MRAARKEPQSTGAAVSSRGTSPGPPRAAPAPVPPASRDPEALVATAPCSVLQTLSGQRRSRRCCQAPSGEEESAEMSSRSTSRPTSAPSAARSWASWAIGSGHCQPRTLKRSLTTAPVFRTFDSGRGSAVTSDAIWIHLGILRSRGAELAASGDLSCCSRCLHCC